MVVLSSSSSVVCKEAGMLEAWGVVVLLRKTGLMAEGI